VIIRLLQGWLESEGIEVNDPESNGAPVDPYSESRKQTETSKVTLGTSEMDKLRQFLEMDRKVLRFYCVWDDRDQMFGEARKFILHVSQISRARLMIITRLHYL